MMRVLARKAAANVALAGLAAGAVLTLTGCGALVSAGLRPGLEGADRIEAWPTVQKRKVDAALEARVEAILSTMTLEQKIGQMTQPDIRWVTPDQVRQYYIGSVLNGGGGWPNNHRQAPPAEWAALSARYYEASMSTDMTTPVPVIWGTDAVHGHNNVYGDTLFPHNIGLGAARDLELIYRIGRSTARSVRATGITWAFAPTLAVVQDQRWGRTYESFSSDSMLVRRYATSYVRGLQGALKGDQDVLATAKHFLGDGGTFNGVDQGDTRVSLNEIIRTHAQGYFGALDGGVQTVMVSYSSWNEQGVGERGVRMHANRYLITDILKGRLGFDGIVVSDWNAIEQVPGCSRTRCPEAINAGVDMVMAPEEWQGFIRDTIADVRSGAIPEARIDDAVRRILRVKLRSGLFQSNPGIVASRVVSDGAADAALAREAVRKSLVLLKNDRGVLPLARGGRILVVGRGADSFALQTGGWSRTWQGDENVNEDFGIGQTLLGAIRDVVGTANVTYSETGDGVDVTRYDAVIAVLAENPYAEGKGDVTYPAPMTHSARYPADLAALDAVAGKGPPVVTVLYSGRTLYANDLINRSDAFVAAWLPGTEAGGIADILFRGANGRPRYEVSGLLPFAWPGSPCDSVGRSPLFPVGYGLRYSSQRTVGRLPETSATTCVN